MDEVSLYRSKLRSPNGKSETPTKCGKPLSTFQDCGTSNLNSQFLTPSKSFVDDFTSPHKSGYFLRTPSPLKSLRALTKHENQGTPSPQKGNGGTDLFGNRSLLDNLEVPEGWDENFLNHFQDDWLFGLGADDLDAFGNRSPLKSPRVGLNYLNNTPKKMGSSLSPMKSPLLTSSPKCYNSSPGGDKTPGFSGSRPLTRQRKLFLQSPDRQQSPAISNQQSSLPAPIPFGSLLDTSSSSIFSEGGMESSSTVHSISSYLKNFDDEEHQEDVPAMLPSGWTSTSGKERVGKVLSKSSIKSSKSKHDRSFSKLQLSGPVPTGTTTLRPAVHSQPSQTCSKKMNDGIHRKHKSEPQFTLLRPYTPIHSNQISLRTTPVTPPNKVKISRDFSQIQTLPSKEQLRIVRNRFRDTLNKAVEQVIEKEKLQKGISPSSNIITANNNMNTVNVIQPGSVISQTVLQPMNILPQQTFVSSNINNNPQFTQLIPQASIQISNILTPCAISQLNVAAAVNQPQLKKRRL